MITSIRATVTFHVLGESVSHVVSLGETLIAAVEEVVSATEALPETFMLENVIVYRSLGMMRQWLHVDATMGEVGIRDQVCRR